MSFTNVSTAIKSSTNSFLLDQDLSTAPNYVAKAEGNYIKLGGSQKIFDTISSAAVACIRHGNEEVIEAVRRQVLQISYCHSMFFKTNCTDTLQRS